MPTSKVLLKKRAAALKLKLSKAAEVHKQAHLEALRHAQEAADLEAELEGEGTVPEPPSLQLKDAPRPCPDAWRREAVMAESCRPTDGLPAREIPEPAKQSWWQRFFG